jgi:superfamily I DNA and/or RNA helicase
VLDEAGAMSKADAILVWGAECRPCAMAGDEKQLPPAVMLLSVQHEGN